MAAGDSGFFPSYNNGPIYVLIALLHFSEGKGGMSSKT